MPTDEGIIMIHVLLSDRGEVIGATDTFAKIKVTTKHVAGYGLSIAVAYEYARRLNALHTPHHYMVLPEAKGRKTTYRVVIAPKSGDLVSSVLSGIETPAGIIVKVSPSYNRIVTDSGRVFFRHSNSCRWMCDNEALIVVSRS